MNNNQYYPGYIIDNNYPSYYPDYQTNRNEQNQIYYQNPQDDRFLF